MDKNLGQISHMSQKANYKIISSPLIHLASLLPQNTVAAAEPQKKQPGDDDDDGGGDGGNNNKVSNKSKMYL